MRTYQAEAENSRCKIGCTSKYTYILDPAGKELARFPGSSNARIAAISGDERVAVVKSTSGRLELFDLKTLTLRHRLQVARNCAQDEGLCFSADSRYLYNIERRANVSQCFLVRYDVQTLEAQTILTPKADIQYLDIWYSQGRQCYCILGLLHKARGGIQEFVAFFDGEAITDVEMLPSRSPSAGSPTQKFTSFAKSQSYTVGCTGKTIAVLDGTGRELAHFPTDRNAAMTAISPNERYAVVKSTSGLLYLLDLQALAVKAEIKLPGRTAQHGWLCFSPDSRYLYSVETPAENVTELARYDLETLARHAVIPAQRVYSISGLRYSQRLGTYCVHGYYWKKGCYFALFDGEKIHDVQIMDEYDASHHFLQMTMPQKA